MPVRMRDQYSGSLLHYVIGLDLTVHTRCGCGHAEQFAQNRDQYLVMGLVFNVLKDVQLTRDDTPQTNEQKMEQAQGTFMSALKQLYASSLVEVEEQDHYKECSQSAQTEAIVSTNKEPEILTFDLKWAEVKPLDLLQLYNMLPNTMRLSELFTLEG